MSFFMSISLLIFYKTIDRNPLEDRFSEIDGQLLLTLDANTLSIDQICYNNHYLIAIINAEKQAKYLLLNRWNNEVEYLQSSKSMDAFRKKHKMDQLAFQNAKNCWRDIQLQDLWSWKP